MTDGTSSKGSPASRHVHRKRRRPFLGSSTLRNPFRVDWIGVHLLFVCCCWSIFLSRSSAVDAFVPPLSTQSNGNVILSPKSPPFARISNCAFVDVVGSDQASRRQTTELSSDDDNRNNDNNNVPRSTENPATFRFHDDMRRVLASRKLLLQEHLESSRERSQKPLILNSDVDGAERVLSMLNHLENIGAATLESYEIVMEAFVGRGRLRWFQNETEIVCAADALETLLERLLETVPGTSVTMDVYNLVLEAYAICATPRGERDYARRANELLERVEAMFGDVSVTSLMHVLHAYAWQQGNLDQGYCAQHAHDLLHRIQSSIMTSPQNDSKEGTCADADPAVLMRCYDLVLEAWSKSGDAGSAGKADTLFRHMTALNATLFNQPKASAILDAQTYSNAILAWSKASEAQSAEKAQELLMKMIDLYENGAFPSGSELPLIAFNSVITAWGRRGQADKAEQILWLTDTTQQSCASLALDSRSFNSVIHAYLRSPLRTLDHPQSLVRYMEENCKKQPKITPNCFTYHTLLKCIVQSKQPDTVELAEHALLTMERLWKRGDKSFAPNNRVYNMVINAFAKSDNHRLAGVKALGLLDRMKQSKHCQPDIISYTSVMECLSKSSDPNAPPQAEVLLQEASERYRATGEPAMMPNLRTFTMAILTLSRNYGDIVRARALLDQLLDLYEETGDVQLRPNEFPYNYVLSCAANHPVVETRLEAFKIATKTYQDMRQSKLVAPDSFTYGFWLKCCNKLLPDSDLRSKCVSYAMEECKRDGLLTNPVLMRLFQGNPPKVIDEILELGDEPQRPAYRSIKVRDLPIKWSRNAVK